jgi:hypothetical protein
MKKWIAALIIGLFALSACGEGAVEPAGDDETIPSVLGPNEKADDFRSESAQEYFVRGETTISLDASYADLGEEARLQRVRELIPYKQVVIGWFLNAYLIDKSGDGDNAEYGGVKALTKNGSYEDLGIEKLDDLTYSFEFVQEVGGQFDLIDELGQTADAEPNVDGSWTFELAVGEVSNIEMEQLEYNNEWYRSSPWSSFTPDNVDESRYYMQELHIEQQERSDDAWIDYKRLFEDGTLDVEVFFGWDYHDAYHQKHARSTYEWLIRHGFDSPVDSWDAYAQNRAPITRTLSTPDGPVDVAVTLWWGEPGTSTDPDTDAGGIALENAMRESFTKNEVTMFSGHSGPWYGFALANWRTTLEGDLDDSEIPTLDMPADKYQIVVAEGCDTYALGESFWKNPNKSNRQNLDIITTTSFSNAGTEKAVTDLLGAVLALDSRDHFVPQRYSTLLEDLDGNSYWFQTMYGVHGIDNNPHAHPYAATDAICDECSSSADCGGTGNVCANLEGQNVCTYECTADDGCPDGFSCRETRTGSWLSTNVCVPTTFTCDEIDRGGDDQPNVQISELLADPAAGIAGDINGDGVRDARSDEFIELFNPADTAVELGGWTISDNVSVRYTFPANATIEAGQHLVIFGGGDLQSFEGLGDASVLVADGLYLNNGGDSITLANRDGDKADQVAYGAEGGEDRALVRNGDTFAPTETATPGY